MYQNVPEIVIKVIYATAIEGVASIRYNNEFEKYKDKMGLTPHHIKSTDLYIKLSNSRKDSLRALENICKIANKDSDYLSYRMKWRSKTMMQPSIKAAGKITSEMYHNNVIYDYDTFKEKYLHQLEIEYKNQLYILNK